MYFVSQEMPISVLPAISNVWTKHLVSKHFSFLLTPWSIIPLAVVGTNNSIPDKQMFLCTDRGERHRITQRIGALTSLTELEIAVVHYPRCPLAVIARCRCLVPLSL